MPRFVTPSGVLIEMSEEAASRVGYKSEGDTTAPAKRGRPKKVDESSAE